MMMILKQMNKMNQNINLQIELKFKKIIKVKGIKSLTQMKVNNNNNKQIQNSINKKTIRINLFVKILKLVNKIMNYKQGIKLKLIKVMRKPPIQIKNLNYLIYKIMKKIKNRKMLHLKIN